MRSELRCGHNEQKKQILTMLSNRQMDSKEVARAAKIALKTSGKLLLNYFRLGLVTRKTKSGAATGKGKYLYRLSERGREKLKILRTTPRQRWPEQPPHL